MNNKQLKKYLIFLYSLEAILLSCVLLPAIFSKSYTVIDLTKINNYGTINENCDFSPNVFGHFFAFKCENECSKYCYLNFGCQYNVPRNDLNRTSIGCVFVTVYNRRHEALNLPFDHCYRHGDIQWHLLEKTYNSFDNVINDRYIWLMFMMLPIIILFLLAIITNLITRLKKSDFIKKHYV